ncbi:Ig-like domain repeat protein [Streptomyces vinaceus]
MSRTRASRRTGNRKTRWAACASAVLLVSGGATLVPALAAHAQAAQPSLTAPLALDDAYATAAETALDVSAPGVLGNDVDPDGDPLIAILVSTPGHGRVTFRLDGSFRYVPEPGFTGTDTFTYAASDRQQRSAPATVSVNVEPPATQVTTTTLATSPNPSTAGQPVTLTAAVTPAATAGGIITFKDDTATLGTATLGPDGTATLTTTTLAAGTHSIIAEYPGNNAYDPSTSPAVTQTVDKATTALTAGRATVRPLIGARVQVIGLNSTLTSDGQPLPGQTITFTSRSGNIPLCTATTNSAGTATCDAVLAQGLVPNLVINAELLAHGYRATYTGDPNHQPAAPATGTVGIL